ncbi:DUF2971 domain-containing protein [Vibrio splendidus]
MKLKYNIHNDYYKFISSEDALFHFTSKETALEYILFNRTLLMGEFSGTNDPQEYKPKLTGAIGGGWEEHHNKKVDDATSSIDQLLRVKSKFLSLCQNDIVDGNLRAHGALKSRMWAQYGDNHKGACVVLSKAKLIDQLKAQLKANYRIHYSDVRYEEPDLNRNIPCLNIDGSELDSLSSSEIAINYVNKYIEELFFTKQPDYKDEMEFRYVATPTSLESVSVPIYIDLLKCVHSVILGDAFPKVYQPTILNLAQQLSIPIKKLHWEHHAYLLLDWDKS